ncbi:MAG: hypothetical protein Q9198_002120 [Flavoplaca austrocitrina]
MQQNREPKWLPSKPGGFKSSAIKNITELTDKGVELDRKTYISRDEYEDGNIQQKFKDSYTVKELEREGVFDQISNSDLKPVFDDLGVSQLEDVREYFSPENDLNAPGQRLNLSDLTFILWKDATDDKRVERLQAYVIQNVVSKITLELLQKAEYHDLHSKFFTTTFTRTDRAGRRAVFDMLMGTYEISALTYMFKDHAPVLGRKRIFSIWCYPKTAGGVLEEYINMVVYFQSQMIALRAAK